MALYIDTKYEVTKSIRIVLQYDVEVIMGWVSNLAMNEKDNDATVDDEDGDELFDYMEDISIQCKHYLDSTGPLTADNANATKVTDIIASLLADGMSASHPPLAHQLRRPLCILPFSGTVVHLVPTLNRTKNQRMLNPTPGPTQDQRVMKTTAVCNPWCYICRCFPRLNRSVIQNTSNTR